MYYDYKKIVEELVFRSCGTFSYRERLQQQNGDIRKRDGRENFMYMGAVSDKDTLAPPPLPSPPLQMR
jgi:hypothetical protein